MLSDSVIEVECLPKKNVSLRASAAQTAEDFHRLFETERDALMELCSTWENALENVPAAAVGDVRVAVGKAHLLDQERLEQFAGLVDQFASGTSVKPITANDLQGFWDVICTQVWKLSASHGADRLG